MDIKDKDLQKILLNGNYLEEKELVKAVYEANSRHISLSDYLIEEELLNEDLIGQAIAEFFKLPYVDLNTQIPPQEQVLRIPEEIAKKFRLILFSENKNNIILTTDLPTNINLLKKIETLFPKKKVSLAYSLTKDINEALGAYRKTLETRFSKIIEKEERVAPEIIEEILADAVAFKTSDIHFEPQDKEVIVRFRIDGVMQEAGRIPKEYYENIINRLKIQAHLRIDEHFAAQDGAIRFKQAERLIDARLSLVPTLDGEKIVLRLLADYMRSFALSDLGFLPEEQKIIEEAAKKPFGMILVTGPTGSGKTTTLYALIKTLNNPNVNITTIEDPVEFKISGANQIQVNPQTNLTFAKGLKSIVRQDPDIILVGEIRDQETAEIAVNAALTGHLLLSTFHANDAATSIPRLIEMGIEPFLLSSTLNLVIAQRLTRRICENCRYSKNVSLSEVEKTLTNAKKFFTGKSITLYQGKGCSACSGTGYKGRIGIFEFIHLTPAMQALILRHPSSQQIWELAQKEGSLSLFADGIKKVKNGLTTLEELIRVANPPYDKK